MSEPENIKLLPCPFCGKGDAAKFLSAAEMIMEIGPDIDLDVEDECVEGFFVCCDGSNRGPGGCGSSGPWGSTVEEAAEGWNRRPANTKP